MKIFFTDFESYDMLPFIRLMSRGRKMDGNIKLFASESPLNQAVSYRGRMHTDPNPDLVRFLIDKLGADTTRRNWENRTPLEELIHNASWQETEDANDDDWHRRVEETKRVLMRQDMATAFAMGGHSRLGRASVALRLDTNTINSIARNVIENDAI